MSRTPPDDTRSDDTRCEPAGSDPTRGSAGPVITVNGTAHEIPAGTSVRGLLERLGLAGRRVAVAVNRTVVPRSAYDTQRLAAGDRVEVLEAVGGG